MFQNPFLRKPASQGVPIVVGIVVLAHFGALSCQPEEPSTDDVVVTQPSTDDATVAQPSTDDATVTQPSTDDATVAQPSTDDATVTQPSTDDATVAQPSTDDATVTQPSTDDATVAQPSTDDATVTQPSTDDATVAQPSTDNAMLTHIHVQAGAVNVINNNDFPWHGLIITVNDDYSTRYHFDDPDSDYSWIRADSILDPGELYNPSLDAFINKDGNEFEGILYTITVKKVKLEAKSQPDGPYDLRFSTSTADANATPTPVRRPRIRIHNESGSKSTWVEHHEPEYDEVLAFVSNYPQTAFGSYRLPTDAYQELQVMLGVEPSLTREEQEELERWKEQFDVHWPNIDAFKASMASISADRIVDREELMHICFVLEQWTTQMTDARDYVQDYRRDEPETVEENPGLGLLEQEAERALALLSEVECA